MELRGPRLDRIRNALALKGYRHIRVVRGITFRHEADKVTVSVPPVGGEPVRLLRAPDLPSEDDAFSLLEKDFPGISRVYVRASLDAEICADQGGRPPILLCIGPTGSGKAGTIILVMTIVGDELLKAKLDAESDEKFWRDLGAALAAGHRGFQFDEVGRMKGVDQLMRRILEISGTTRWRPCYRNTETTTPTRAAFFITTAVPPECLLRSAEFCRRAWLVRLHETVPDWGKTAGAIENWRNTPGHAKERARITNSLLTHAYARCVEHEFDFDRLAQLHGLTKPDEGTAVIDQDALSRLYRHCRGEVGERRLHSKGRFRQGGRVDANSRDCKAILDELLADEGDARTGDLGDRL